MEVAVPISRAGALASAGRGRNMIDLVQAAESFGFAGVVAFATWFVSRADQKKRDQTADVANRIAEALALRESDRAEHALVLARLKDLEVWKTQADREIAELHTDKFALEARAFTLEQQIATLNVQIYEYQKNEREFKLQIDVLNEMLAAKKGELQAALERIEAIKNAQSKGEMTHSVLYQKTSDGTTETAILTEKPGEII